jgi:DNA-binding transcriptional regulator YiaG
MSEDYHYTGCGLDNVWLRNGYRLVADVYGESVHIEDLPGLHRAIAQLVLAKPAPLTGSEVRFLRIEMDLSQKALGVLLGKRAQTVALWEKGRARVPSAADFLLRHIYKQAIGQRSVYVDEVERLRALDQIDHERSLVLQESREGWQAAA